MPRLNSVIRRYTPPTCTLEILAQSSPLSHLMGKTVIKQLSFELYFDAPQLPEEGKILVRGDRDQLENLCDVVTSYVQEFLQQPPDNFWLSLTEPQDSNKVSHELELSGSNPSLLGNIKTFKSFTSQTSQGKIYLEPANYLTHNLFLGSLANQTTGSIIKLSLLQLFDLATALDGYSTDIMALPNETQKNLNLRLPAWAPIAAVMVLGVGLLPVTWQFANSKRQNQPQTAKISKPQEGKTALEPLSSFQVPRLPTEFTPSHDLKQLPPVGSNSQFPSVTLSEQISQASNSDLFRNSSSSVSSAQAPLSIFKSKARDINSNLGTITSTTPQQTITALSNPQNESALTQKRSLTPSLSAKGDALPGISSLPLSVSGNANKKISQTPSSSDSLVNQQQIETAINSSVNVDVEVDNQSSLLTRSMSQPVRTKIEESGTQRTLFDTPQVAEAREIFTKRWQPPTGFTETLEYSLIVDIDGSIERIYPLNQAATKFIESSGIPEIGQPFVSANKNREILKIRVVLSPDGKVQTFPEN
ncbi:DUF4335 domain-containing protein [Umezakia ovalisporum]|uniref:DUF4335 domain-containing protein n=1 Tax=Umezakia ovalisporum TaxID=75695 RepID=UPI0024769F28|nr:DUF4335 domain-containing protein [Umezakia ovalisporum]MDH6084989.1 DUF4335 domain-containing protein [Umezakia ovalisporum TAC611]